MSARILDGKTVAGQLHEELRSRVLGLQAQGIIPKLGIVLAGDFAPSQIYVRNKEKTGSKVGVEVETARLPASVSPGELVAKVRDWNQDRSVHGVIIQMPLPNGIDSPSLLETIAPEKDVDGLTQVSLGKLVQGKPGFLPATPAGIVELLCRSGIRIAGQRVVIVGRGGLVGRPLANMLLLRGDRGDATVTVCHSQTRDLGEVCREADILVVAVGRPRLVTGEMVKPGAVVVDVGIHRLGDGIVGDVDTESVAARASAITPVPGGVGPMTVAMVLANTVAAAEGGAG